MTRSLGRIAARFIARAQAWLGIGVGLMIAIEHRYTAEFRDRDGNLLAVRTATNLVVTTGLNDILDKYYNGVAYTAAHFIGLTDGTPTVAAGDTMASHAGWVEVTSYTVNSSPASALRDTFDPGAAAAGSMNNSSLPAVFTTTSSTTTGGLFLTTSAVKGGTSGILIGAVAFTEGDVTVPTSSTITVTLTASATSS